MFQFIQNNVFDPNTCTLQRSPIMGFVDVHQVNFPIWGWKNPIKILNKDLSANSHDETKFKYHFEIRNPEFLEKFTRSDIDYSVHQWPRFSEDLIQSHNKSVNNLVRYLVVTKDKSLILDLRYHYFKCWANTGFQGNCFKQEAHFNSDTARSRTGFEITYAGCTIVWASQLQVLISLSTT